MLPNVYVSSIQELYNILYYRPPAKVCYHVYCQKFTLSADKVDAPITKLTRVERSEMLSSGLIAFRILRFSVLYHYKI